MQLLTLELFTHRIYKNLDDHVLVSDMSDTDEIACFELPCHSQQSRTYKKQEGDPFIVPIVFTQSPRTRSGYSICLLGELMLNALQKFRSALADTAKVLDNARSTAIAANLEQLKFHLEYVS